MARPRRTAVMSDRVRLALGLLAFLLIIAPVIAIT
jgi:hypothetical protein